MAGSPLKTYTVFLSPMHVVNVTADVVEHYAATLVFRRDGQVVGMFQSWQAYAEHVDEAARAKIPKESGTVLQLVPTTPGEPGAPPEGAA